MIKKLIYLFCFSLSFLCYAQTADNDIPEIIRYAINNDYENFKLYVETNGDLNVSTKAGMSLQMSLAYFSDKNFESACKLLLKHNVDLDKPNSDNMSLLHYLCYSGSINKIKYLLSTNPQTNRSTISLGLTPAQMTQFSTYYYYADQPDLSKNYENAEKIRNLLKVNKKDFKYSDVTYGNFGNLIMLAINTAASFYPDLPYQSFFSPDLVELQTVNKQKMAVVTKDLLEKYLDYWKLDSYIFNFNNREEIDQLLTLCNQSEEHFLMFVLTGNSPIAPFQWGAVNGFNDTNLTKDTIVNLTIVDNNFNNLVYRISDISFLILIKLDI